MVAMPAQSIASTRAHAVKVEDRPVNTQLLFDRNDCSAEQEWDDLWMMPKVSIGFVSLISSSRWRRLSSLRPYWCWWAWRSN
jgi:hypothetical protein